MKALLQSEVELWNIAVFAELAVWESRPELRLLCAAAAKQGALTDDVVDQVLPGLRERGRRNLLRHLEYLQLTTGAGTLTALGQRCAQSGDAPSWEQGAYHLLVARHPLFGARVLDFRRAPGDGQDRDFSSLEAIPSWLVADRERVVTSAMDPDRRFSIAAFPAPRGQDATCRASELNPAKLSWEIDMRTGANQWTIAGQVGAEDSNRSFTTSAESIDAKELVGLYATWEKRWDASQARVLMPFDGRLSPGGRESFKRAWRYKSVKVGKYGAYEDVVVQEVPVGPATDDDARAWATAMLIGRVEAAGKYVSPVDLGKDWAEIAGAPPLAGRVTAPPPPDGVRDVSGKPVAARTRWLLTAPADLSVEG